MVTEEIADILTEEGRFEAYRLKKVLWQRQHFTSGGDVETKETAMAKKEMCSACQLVSAPADLRKLLQK